MIAQNSTNDGVRMPQGVVGQMTNMVKKAYQNSVETVLTNYDAYRFTEEAWNQMQELGRQIVSDYLVPITKSVHP